MKYKSQSDVISAAQARGSKSTKYPRAVKYLLAHPESDNNGGFAPVYTRGNPARIRYISAHTLSARILISIAQGCAASAKKSEKLYIRSKYAFWVAHTSSTTDTVRYSVSSGCYPLKYTNPGIVATPLRGGNVRVDVYDYTGAIRNAVIIPGRCVPRLTTDGQLSTDVYAVYRHRGVVQRYDARGRCVGYAVLLPNRVWEHGDTIAVIRAEIAHKRAVAEQEAARKQKTLKQARCARLVLRLCRNLTLSYDDARAVGYCEAGINDWRAKNRIGTDKITISQIPQTADKQWIRVAEYRANQIAVEVVNG